MGRAHDPRSAAIGGSCEDRRLAESTGGERHTVTQAGPLGASYRCSGPTCLWRAATEEGPGAMNLIHTIEAEKIAKAARHIPKIRPGTTLRAGVRFVAGHITRAQIFECGRHDRP